MRSYWFGPSQKCAMRALATLPPPLTTKVPWKLRRLAASWMRSSQARTSLGARRRRRGARAGCTPARHAPTAAQARVSESERARQQHGGGRAQRGAASTVALRRNADGTPSADVPANCLCAAR